MGLFSFFRRFGDPRAVLQMNAKTVERGFVLARRVAPDRDLNAWMAQVIQARPGWKGRTDLIYYTETALFSMMPEPDGPAAFGLYVACKELRGQYPEVVAEAERDYERLMAPAFEALATIDADELLRRWKIRNPWTAEKYPYVGEGLKEARNSLVAGLDSNV